MFKEITGNKHYTVLKAFKIMGIHHLEREKRIFAKDIEEIKWPILVSSQYGWEDGCRDYYSVLYPPFRLEKCIFGNIDRLSHITIGCSNSIEITTKNAKKIKERFSILANWENWIKWRLIPNIDAIENIYITKFLLYLENTYSKKGLQKGWENIILDITNPNTELYNKYNSVLGEIEETKKDCNEKVIKIFKQLSKYPFGSYCKLQKFDKYSVGLYSTKEKTWKESCGLLLPELYPSIASKLEDINNFLLIIKEIDSWKERSENINYNDMLNMIVI